MFGGYARRHAPRKPLWPVPPRSPAPEPFQPSSITDACPFDGCAAEILYAIVQATDDVDDFCGESNTRRTACCEADIVIHH